MSHAAMPHPAASTRRKRSPAARLRLPLLLVVVLVGLLGALRIWRTVVPFSFTVEVVPEPDLTGEGAQGLLLLDTGELLATMEYQLRLNASSPPLTAAPLPPARERRAKVTVKGAPARRAVRAGNVVGVLHYPGADPDRLTLELKLATFDQGVLRQQLSHADAAALLSDRVSTFVSLRNQANDPVRGLRAAQRADIGERAAEPGVYDVPIQVDLLLSSLGTGDESFHVELTRPEDGTRWPVDIPLGWFVAKGIDPHVVHVQEAIATMAPAARVSGVEPSRVSLAAGWEGRLRVTGFDLDRVAVATLQRGTQSIACQIVNRAKESLDLALAPAQLLPGAWNLVLSSSAEQEPLRVPGALRVEAGLSWELPRSGQRVAAGSQVELRWGASGLEGQILIEASASGGGSEWMRVYAGLLSTGSASWSTAGLSPGSYLLRMTAPGVAGVQPLQRRIELEPPPTLQVIVRFRRGGQPFGNVRQVIVDDQAFEPPADPMIWKLPLTPGQHMLKVRGALLPSKLYPIEVTAEGQQIEIDLGS